MIFGSERVSPEKLEYVQHNTPLLLVAYTNKLPVGFKLGYTIPGTSTFFSWLGGVHPTYRQQGIAQHLLYLQETAARERGMDKIYFTSFDRFPKMISLGKKNGYKLVRSAHDRGEKKYWYEKAL